MDLNEFNERYDWAGSFDSGMGAVYEASRKPDPLPGYKGPVAWTKDDVAEVLCASDGENDGINWLALLRLRDARFVFLSAGCDYTGWDCQASGRSIVALDKAHLINLGMDAEDRHRLDLDAVDVPDPFLASVVKDPKRHAVPKRSMFKHVVHEKGHPLNGKEIALYVHQMTGREVDCPGDAHSNPFIDNCGVCVPNWGKVPEHLPVDMEEARTLGLAVSLTSDVTNEQVKAECAKGASLIGVAKLRRKNGGLCSSFTVLAWPTLKAIG